MRSFFAIDLNDEVRYEAVKLIKFLKKQKHYHHIKWTKPENLHLTMRFLGNISWLQYEQIVREVGQALHNIDPFSINFTELILFPSPKKPIAIALKPEPMALLIQLNQLLEQSVIKYDIKPEPRPFVPHLTLGKIKTRRALIRVNDYSPLPNMEQEVKDIKLFRSQTGMNGSVYTQLVCILF
jgi:2'-5' RNA ligase